MATLGSTSHVSDTADATTGSAKSQVATPLTFPSGGGTITFVSVYMAGYGGSCSTRCAVWNTSGTSLEESSTFTATSRTFANGNSDHYNKAMPVPVVVASGATVWAGFLRTTSDDGFQWDKDDGSGKTTKFGSGLTGNMTSISTDSNSKPNVYLTYETVPQLYVRRSGAWTRVDDLYVRRSGAWDSVGPEMYIRRSGAWAKVD
jgi:hypothetical protein